MEKKKIKRFFNLTLNACISRFEDSCIGPILSPFINKEKINSFCLEFNLKSKTYKSGLPLRVNFCLFFDNSFFFFIKGVNFSSLLKIIFSLESISSNKSIEVSLIDLFFICILKNNFLNNKKKIYNKFFFYSILGSINSIKNLVIKNETRIEQQNL